MLRKLTIALAATLALGAGALAPSAASAKHFGGMGGMGHFGGFHHFHHFGGIGFVGAVAADVAEESCFVTQRVMTPYGYRFRTVNVCGY
jgi:hypothetical protein